MRHFYAFLFATLINFLLALMAPLWMLILGPIILGFPHIAMVMREVPRLNRVLGETFSMRSIGWIFASIALLHFIFNRIAGIAFSSLPNFVELLGILLIFVTVFWFVRWGDGQLRSFSRAIFLLGLLVLFSLFYPLETLGALVLIHNFIGFFYWIRATKSREERRVAWSSLFVFTLLTGLILFGFFDFVIQSREKEILQGSLNEFSIGRFIFPHSSAVLWNRAVSAFAFGQGVHYFVWLKAIPDRSVFSGEEFIREPAPSLKKIIHSKILRTMGRIHSLILFACLGSLALLVYALFTSFAEARLVYLGIAAFHGYFEIVGLSFFDRARA